MIPLMNTYPVRTTQREWFYSEVCAVQFNSACRFSKAAWDRLNDRDLRKIKKINKTANN